MPDSSSSRWRRSSKRERPKEMSARVAMVRDSVAQPVARDLTGPRAAAADSGTLSPVSRESFSVEVPGGALAADGWRGAGPTVVLLHAGVADRRGWTGVGDRLAATGLDVVAYDRRGFGATPPGEGRFTHLDDLRAVLDATAGDRPAWLVGNSMGGALALDAALALPERIAGLVLLAPAVSGSPEAEDLDQPTLDLVARLDDADGEEALRLETWLWLDGPAEPEGRVGGGARELALEMHRAIMAHGAPGDAGASGIEAAGRLDELR